MVKLVIGLVTLFFAALDRLDGIAYSVVSFVTGHRTRVQIAARSVEAQAFADEVKDIDRMEGTNPRGSWTDMFVEIGEQPIGSLYVTFEVTILVSYVLSQVLIEHGADATETLTWLIVAGILLTTVVSAVHVPSQLGSPQIGATFVAAMLLAFWGVRTGWDQIGELVPNFWVWLALGYPVGAILLVLPLVVIVKNGATTGSTRLLAIPGWTMISVGAISTYVRTGAAGNVYTAIAAGAAAIAAASSNPRRGTDGC